jgi:hypothetical protein
MFSETFNNVIYKWVLFFLNCSNILVNEQFDLWKNLTVDKATYE